MEIGGGKLAARPEGRESRGENRCSSEEDNRGAWREGKLALDRGSKRRASDLSGRVVEGERESERRQGGSEGECSNRGGCYCYHCLNRLAVSRACYVANTSSSSSTSSEQRRLATRSTHNAANVAFMASSQRIISTSSLYTRSVLLSNANRFLAQINNPLLGIQLTGFYRVWKQYKSLLAFF